MPQLPCVQALPSLEGFDLLRDFPGDDPYCTLDPLFSPPKHPSRSPEAGAGVFAGAEHVSLSPSSLLSHRSMQLDLSPCSAALIHGAFDSLLSGGCAFDDFGGFGNDKGVFRAASMGTGGPTAVASAANVVRHASTGSNNGGHGEAAPPPAFSPNSNALAGGAGVPRRSSVSSLSSVAHTTAATPAAGSGGWQPPPRADAPCDRINRLLQDVLGVPAARSEPSNYPVIPAFAAAVAERLAAGPPPTTARGR